MAAYLLAKISLPSSFCLVLGVLGSGACLAQTVRQADGSAAATSTECAGALCALTPGSMDRPILADEAKRMEAERANRSAPEAVAASTGDGDHRHHAARGPRHQVVAQSRPRRAFDGRSVARVVRIARHAAPIAVAPAAVIPTRPINAIFVLAPRPFDPYGGDYAHWLNRLAWPSQSDRAGDRTVFSAEGYSETEVSAEPTTLIGDELSRRSNALSRLGFQALKADLGGS